MRCTTELLEPRRLLCTLGHDEAGPSEVHLYDAQGEHLDFQEVPDAGTVDLTAPFIGPQQFVTESAGVAAASVPAAAGGLSGKIAYVNAGHGWTFNGSSWATQRPEYQEIVEDFHTQDQITYYAQYMLNAGATVVPTRPLGHQLNEIIVDNNDAGFSIQSGSWSTNTGSSTYWSNQNGTDSSNRYRFANVSATETAVARFTPNIPAAGFYPVYAWWNNGSNRSTGVTYRINSAGGSQEVKVNQRYTGKGWAYLGSYYFNAGTGGNVEVSNKAGDGSAVIADAVRFGNGMGTSGRPKEEELSLYWLYESRGWTGAGTRVAQSTVDGGNTSHNSAGIVAPPRWVSYMNDENQGSNVDRLHLSVHSNGTTGLPDASARGTLALLNNTASWRTLNQQWWADAIAEEVEEDMQALPAGTLEHTWAARANVYSSSNYGEINENNFDAFNSNTANSEMAATLLEVLFHDNLQDSQLMRDPKVRDWVGRASYQAAAKYFNTFAGTTSTLLPDPPTNVRATTDASGNVTVSWTAPGTGGANGEAGAPSGYKVLFGTTGYTWSDAVVLGNVTSHTFAPGSLPTGVMTYFKVVATNAGGESFQRDVVAAKTQVGRRAPILIVNGFDRIDRFGNDTTPWSPNNGITERVRLRYQNTRDYVVQFAEAVEAYNPVLGVETVQNESVTAGQVNLTNYHAVLWISGEESTANETFSATERSLLTTYLNGGGKLFTSGAEIGLHLDQSGADPGFYNNQLRANFVNDDANSYTASGVAGSIFNGVSSVGFDNGSAEGASGTYDVDTPDVIAPINGSTAAMTYSTGTTAAIQYSSGATRVVTMGFPFETITDPAKRNGVMSGVLEFFQANSTVISMAPTSIDLVNSSDTGSSNTDNRTNRNNSSAIKALQFNVFGTVAGATVTIYADGVAIGSAGGLAGTTTVDTNGTTALLDGVRVITARQTESGLAESPDSPSLDVVIDTVAPVATFTPVSPDPRTTGISSVTLTFTREVNGVDIIDLSLTRDGNVVALTASQAPTTSDNLTFLIPNLSSLTSQSGSYELKLNAAGSGITESLAGNVLTADASETWVHSLPAWLAEGSAASWNSDTDTLTVTGVARIIADPFADLPTINASGAGAVLTINPDSDLAIRVGALNLSDGASATLASLGAARTAANHRVLCILGGTLSIDAASTLDLTDNDLVLDYDGASPAGGIEAMVRSAYNLTGNWQGKGITSSIAAGDANFTLAVADNAALAAPFGSAQGGPNFAGQDVDLTTVLVKFTHRVDVNLDGVITPDDAAIFGTNYSENDAAAWGIGDIDYDALFTPSDAAILGTFYDESLQAV